MSRTCQVWRRGAVVLFAAVVLSLVVQGVVVPVAVPGRVGGAAGVSALPVALQVAEAAPGVVCDGDGVAGKRVQVLYLRAAGRVSRLGEFVQKFRADAAQVDAWYDASAAQTGGSRRIRFVTDGSCAVDVREVQVPDEAFAEAGGIVAALRLAGFDRVDRRYLVLTDDEKASCGLTEQVVDDAPGPGNANNVGPAYAGVGSGCWSARAMARELTRGLGAVSPNAPHGTPSGGCTDGYDLMCDGAPGTAVCAENHRDLLDCNHDDYFSTRPVQGSWLAAHWNVADSEFLIKGEGRTPSPSPPAMPASPADSAVALSAAPGASPATTSPGPAAQTAAPPASAKGGKAASGVSDEAKPTTPSDPTRSSEQENALSTLEQAARLDWLPVPESRVGKIGLFVAVILTFIAGGVAVATRRRWIGG